MKTIAFLTSRIDKPSSRYRISQYLPYLLQNGIDCVLYAIPSNPFERIRFFSHLKRFDIVFLHRKLFNQLDFFVLKRNVKKLIFDFDDALVFKDSNFENPVCLKNESRFIRTIKSSVGVIAGNDYLKEMAKPYNSNIWLLPTPVDMKRYTLKPPSRISSIRLGWIGSSSTLIYLKNILPVIEKIAATQNISLKIISDRFLESDCLKVIPKLWNYEEEISDLHSIDIGLMPLTQDVWAKGKCGFKLIQYMACGIPAVCSPVGINKQIVSDGINGFWAENESEWENKITKLIKYKSLRNSLGESARETIIKHYSLEVNARRLIEVLNRV